MKHVSCSTLPAILAGACITLGAADYSPNADTDIPRRVLWGDTHLHTNMSLDANMLGNSAMTAAESYRLARGEAVVSQTGQPVRLRRPLDFLVVSDHAEYLGVLRGLRDRDALLLTDPVARRWSDGLAAGDPTPMAEFAQSLAAGAPAFTNQEFARSSWDRTIAFAEEFNEPGRFTTLIGYEWTSMPGGRNLHRVVVFRDGGDRVGQVLPFSAFDSDDPEDLWTHLSAYEAQTGGNALSISHNSNLSGGLMFDLVDRSGEPLTADYARLRNTQEPLVEVTQYKGDSETHPFLSPEDEFADYESWDFSADIAFQQPHDDSTFPGEYARSGLLRGLAIERSTGENPYRFGMIGSTDSHTGLPTADENDFWGKMSINEPGPGRWQTTLTGRPLPVQVYQWQMAASGYAAVWASENTRASIFDAMQRRETYATTGPRMTVRFFAGFDFDSSDAAAPDLARAGYRTGVPMGATIGPGAVEEPLGFLVSAMRDPEGANLDRIQIVKGWIDETGTTRERVFNVVWSGNRVRNSDGHLAPVGSTVDIESATWTNAIGASQLTGVWHDPEFDPAQSAFYYARVLEIPTPRWTSFDARVYDLELPAEVPRTTQERAYTSPIWYRPD